MATKGRSEFWDGFTAFGPIWLIFAIILNSFIPPLSFSSEAIFTLTMILLTILINRFLFGDSWRRALGISVSYGAALLLVGWTVLFVRG